MAPRADDGQGGAASIPTCTLRATTTRESNHYSSTAHGAHAHIVRASAQVPTRVQRRLRPRRRVALEANAASPQKPQQGFANAPARVARSALLLLVVDVAIAHSQRNYCNSTWYTAYPVHVYGGLRSAEPHGSSFVSRRMSSSTPGYKGVTAQKPEPAMTESGDTP